MAVNWNGFAFPKTGKRTKKIVRSRSARAVAARKRPRPRSAKQVEDAAILKRLVPTLVERDGARCRALGVGHRCRGPLDPCHLPDWRRSKTRGRPPSERHTLAGLIQLCRVAHRALDEHRLEAAYDLVRGANGPVMFTWATPANPQKKK